MRVESVAVEYANPLVNRYLNDFSQVAEFYVHNPYEAASYQERRRLVRDHYQTDREALVRILTAYNRRLGVGEKALANLELLKQKNAVLVVTGQQAGVLTGPLYTIYKAITAIQLAAGKTTELGVPVIPAFWVAAEDHDFAEIDHLYIIDRVQQPVKLRLDQEPEGKFSVGHIPVNEAVFRLIDEMDAATNPSEWKGEMLAELKRLAREQGNFADWFAAVMAWLFKNTGLVLINPLIPELRAFMKDIFADFILRHEEVQASYNVGLERVKARGYAPQVEKSEEHLHLFRYVDGERLPLLKTGDRVTVRGRELYWSIPELAREARENPCLFSPNVVLRPVAQDRLLPLLAYIAGPGEISYYALYKDIYPLFGMSMPVICPRINITLVERAVQKLLGRYSLGFADVISGLDTRLQEYLRGQDKLDIAGTFTEYKENFRRSYLELIEHLAAMDKGLRAAGEETMGKIMHQIGHFESKTMKVHRKNCDEAVGHFEKLALNLYPRQNWQERVYNIFPYLFKYGLSFIDELAGTDFPDNNCHKLLYPGEP
jgi:bacillithiol biosynthesis cysteine-adding enzyme BshC